MTKFERENYILALNDGQRLALLLSISCHLILDKKLDILDFEQRLTSYRSEKSTREHGPKKRRSP